MPVLLRQGGRWGKRRWWWAEGRPAWVVFLGVGYQALTRISACAGVVEAVPVLLRQSGGVISCCVRVVVRGEVVLVVGGRSTGVGCFLGFGIANTPNFSYIQVNKVV